MNFDFEGLGDQRYLILAQKADPLKYCNYALPFPMPIGLPFMPCDLPNQYELYSTDHLYKQTGQTHLTFEEEVGVMERIIIPASHRPWKITGKDYYNHTPYMAFRNLNMCLSPNDRPEVKVFMQQKYIGRIRQSTILNCCCIAEKFQQFEIYDEHDQIVYKISSKNPQRGHFIILPFWNFHQIKYEILKIRFREQQLANEEEEGTVMEQHVVGEVVHLFNGLSEYTSKNDKYGITLPENSSQEQKCLIIFCTLMIDYLLFQNF